MKVQVLSPWPSRPASPGVLHGFLLVIDPLGGVSYLQEWLSRMLVIACL